ncbi:MAG: caspase family protein [Saprospiraceae bacterium]|nr:caspase family protein [Saprospiraceae bacterium]HMX88938.1 caspase family protein [Saprospiraceae bacterium]HMZ40145.1 caspase family protein [Saprospiraceae bacterium]HNB31404.1 caspase family protein [Saprospiraceae bacterium]HNE62365.1 caspase family protein [Saprospiraceae bacterium]
MSNRFKGIFYSTKLSRFGFTLDRFWCEWIKTFMFFIYAAHILCAQGQRGAIPLRSQIKSHANTYAFIIGISDYRNVPDLMYADRDAISFRNYLLNNASEKCDSQNIQTFLNCEATHINIADALYVLLRKIKPGDRFYFYFAGHGDVEDRSQSENGLLLLHNAPTKDYFGMIHDVLKLTELADYFGGMSKNDIDVICIIDACHSGKLSGGAKGRTHTIRAMQELLSPRTTLMLSCHEEQLSLEGSEWGGGHGIFSYYLESGLLGLADIDRDNLISLVELENYVQKNTYLESEKKQTPVFMGLPNRVVNRISDDQWTLINNQFASRYTPYSQINYKGEIAMYPEEGDSASFLHAHFLEQMKKGQIIGSTTSSAIETYKTLVALRPDSECNDILRRKIITRLNGTFDSLILPLFNNQKPKWRKDKLMQARAELTASLDLISTRHYLYPHLQSRKYFIDAVLNSYVININNYTPADEDAMQQCILNLHKARQLEPQAAYIHYWLGRSYQTKMMFDSSKFYLSQFADLIPFSPVAHNMLGIYYCDHNQYSESITSLKKAVALDSTFQEPVANLIYVYSKMNRYDSALCTAQKFLRAFPESKVILGNLAELYIGLHRFKDAEKIIHKALQKDSVSLSFLYLKGQWFYRQSKYEEAEQFFRRALAIRPMHRMSGYSLSKVLQAQRKYQEAIEVLSRILHNDSADIKTYYEMGICYDLLGDSVNAANCFTQFEQKAKEEDAYAGTMGDLYYFFRKDPVVAEKYYSRAYARDRFELSIISALHVTRRIQNKASDAEELFRNLNSNPACSAYRHYSNLADEAKSNNIQNMAEIVKGIVRTDPDLAWKIKKDPAHAEWVQSPILRKIL